MKLIKYLLISFLFSTLCFGQIVIVNPGGGGPPPIDPPGTTNIPRPDPTQPGGGDFNGRYYEYCGPAYLGFRCNLMRSDGVARLRDEAVAYKERNRAAHKKTLDAETAKVDKDLDAIRDGLVSPSSPAGIKIKQKRDATSVANANTEAINQAALEFKKTANTEIGSGVEVSFGLAYKKSDTRDYVPEAQKVNTVIADRFLTSKIAAEQKRADAIEAQIRKGGYSNAEDRLALVDSGRAAFEISAQSLQEGDTASSSFALKLGTVFLDVAISVTPVIGWGKDAYEAVLGKNLLTGEKLTGFERSMAVVGVLTAGYGSKLALLGKAGILAGILRKGAKAADEVEAVAKVGKEAAEIAEAAAKAGIKDKALIDEVAAAVKEGLPCKIAMHSLKRFFLSFVEDIAYAADCIPGSVETAVKDALEESAFIKKNLTPKKVIAYLENVENVPKPQLVDDMKSIGLKVKGGSPDGRFMEFVDSQTRVRAKIHPPDKVTSYDHLHIYDKNGNPLDKVLKIVSSKSPDAHIPIGG